MNQLNLLQKNSNLSISFKTVEKYLLQKQSTSILNFTTGLYGMLVFAKILDEFLKDLIATSILSTNFTIDPKEDSSQERFIKYKLVNGQEIKIIHDENLDNTGNINEYTGYTIESSTLYLKN